ncbi:unnamed protein product, partial [Laminaria digitata]
RQSGLPDLVLADVVRDAEVVELARDEAFALLEADPQLSRPEHQALAEELRRRFADKVGLASVG